MGDNLVAEHLPTMSEAPGPSLTLHQKRTGSKTLAHVWLCYHAAKIPSWGRHKSSLPLVIRVQQHTKAWVHQNSIWAMHEFIGITYRDSMGVSNSVGVFAQHGCGLPTAAQMGSSLALLSWCAWSLNQSTVTKYFNFRQKLVSVQNTYLIQWTTI